MQHARRNTNRKTMIIIVLSCVLIASIAIFLFVKESDNAVKTVLMNQIEGEIISDTKDDFTIQVSTYFTYRFSKEGLPLAGQTIKVGKKAVIKYAGILNQELDVQDIDITKIAVKNNSDIEKIDSSLQQQIEGMTLQQKVAQMFMVRVPETNAVGVMEKYQFGGYILFSRDFENKRKVDVQEAIKSYQQVANIPLFIATDEEGGQVNRVSQYFRSSPFDSPQDIFNAGGYDGIIVNTTEKAEFLKDFGINVNFAPVCDVSTNPNDFIYPRTFGRDAKATAKYVSVVVETMKEAKQGSVLKHFPGYGNNVDTHTGVAHDNRSLETFEKNDLVPFIAGIEAGCDSVLVSHNIVECMDANVPASLSEYVHRILRDDLHFDGVIITDDLIMDGVKPFGSSEEVAIRAVLCGNDMLLSSDAVIQSEAIVRGVEEGKIPSNQIDRAVYRILVWKKQLGLL